MSAGYPPGAADDPRAPFNLPEGEDHEYTLRVAITGYVEYKTKQASEQLAVSWAIKEASRGRLGERPFYLTDIEIADKPVDIIAVDGVLT